MVVHGARSLAEDPLFVRLLDVDPELLLPYMTSRLGDPRAVVNLRVPGERSRWVFAIPRSDGQVAIGLTGRAQRPALGSFDDLRTGRWPRSAQLAGP